MYKKGRLAIKLLFFSIIITGVCGYSCIMTPAANRIVKVKNGTSGEIRIKEDDFVTFIPQMKNKKKKQSYFYYSPENGKNLFQFGNGKYWVSKKGLATVVVSGIDTQGNLNFMADYNVIIEKKRPARQVVNTISNAKNSKNDVNNNKGNNAQIKNTQDNEDNSDNNPVSNVENNNTVTTQSAIQKTLADVTAVTL